MTAYTNHSSYGGNFGKEILKNLKICDSLEIASGYFGVSQLKLMRKELLSIARRGYCKILIGMVLKEGVSQKQRNELEDLNSALQSINSNSGIFISLQKFHGKIYRFKTRGTETVYVGSSNLSHEGFYSNLEFNTLVVDIASQSNVTNFLDKFFNPLSGMSDSLDSLPLFIKKKRTIELKKESKDLNAYKIRKSSFPKTIPTSTVTIKLRVDDQPISSLNLYFSKGRKSKAGYTFRKWYEVEITPEKSEKKQVDYPRGEFDAYIKDGKNYYKIPMIVSSGKGDKAITSKGNRHILGQYMK